MKFWAILCYYIFSMTAFFSLSLGRPVWKKLGFLFNEPEKSFVRLFYKTGIDIVS